MSDQKIDTQETGSEEEIDLSSIEDQDLPGGETDQGSESEEAEAEAGAEGTDEGGELTQSEEEEFEEVDFGEIEFENPSASQAETESEKEKRKHNDHNAKQRVRLKQTEAELERVKAEQNSGFIAKDPKPKREDFFSEDALYSKFNGNEFQARAAYDDALDDWKDRAKERHLNAVRQLESQVQYERQVLDTEEAFEKSASKYSGRVKNFQANIDNAVKALQIPGQDGQMLDGSMLIKTQYGEDAPLILAAIGASKVVQDKILHARTPQEVHMHLAEVRAKAKNAFSKPRKKISKAGSESSVVGDANSPTTQLEKAMQKAADNKDVKEYRRLKALIATKQKQ